MKNQKTAIILTTLGLLLTLYGFYRFSKGGSGAVAVVFLGVIILSAGLGIFAGKYINEHPLTK